MAETNGIIWDWSCKDSTNILFIYRKRARTEIEIDMRCYTAGSERIGSIFLFRKEREVLTKLKNMMVNGN